MNINNHRYKDVDQCREDHFLFQIVDLTMTSEQFRDCFVVSFPLN